MSSKVSTRSGRSRVSSSSKASSIIKAKKAGAGAELAAKEAEFNALQEQEKLRAETMRIEEKLARNSLELEKSEVKKQMEIAKSKLKGYQEMEEFEDDIEQVEEGSLPKHLTRSTNACDSVTLQSTQQHENVDDSPIIREDTRQSCQTAKPQEPSSDANTTAAIVMAISESFSASRLPTPEQTIFNGEPIKYPDCKSSFHAIIHRKNLSSMDKLYT